ncbi:MAG: toxin-antitoxin system HicB family antitoxin [Terriglobia bacterium]
MTTKIATFPLRLPVSLKAALETISDRDGTSMNQFLVVAAAEKIAAMQTEEFFAQRRNRAGREAFRRILNRQGGEAPSPEDAWNTSDSA